MVLRVMLTYKSMTYAQKAKRILDTAGIVSEVARTPHELTEKGCGYSVRMAESGLAEAAGLLAARGLSPERIYLRGSDGTFSEAGR